MAGKELTLDECRRPGPCVDCDDPKCLLRGKKESDCPKYRCDRPEGERYDCERCAFIDEFIVEMRKEAKKHGDKKA